MKFPLAALLLGFASSSFSGAPVALAFHLPGAGPRVKKAETTVAAVAKKKEPAADPPVGTENRRAFFSSSAAATLAVVLIPWAEPANAYYYKNGKKVDYFGNEVPMYEKIASIRTEGSAAAAWPREVAKFSPGSGPNGANAAIAADQETPADVDMEYPGLELKNSAEEPVDIGPTVGFFPPLQSPPLKSASIKSGDNRGGLEAAGLAAAVVTVPRLFPRNGRESKSPSRRTKKATTAAVAKKVTAPVNGVRVVQRAKKAATAAAAKKATAPINGVRVGQQTNKATTAAVTKKATAPANGVRILQRKGNAAIVKKAAAPANGVRVLQRKGNAGTRAVGTKKALARVNGSRVGQRKKEPATVLFATKKAVGPAPESRRKFFSNSASAMIAAGGTALLFPTEPASAAADNDKAPEEEKAPLEQLPPNVPRVLVLGGTGAVGKKVRSVLEDQLGVYVVATSRDGRDGTLELDVTKCYGKIENEIQKIASDNRCSAVVSLIGGAVEEGDGATLLVNGSTGQAALGASKADTVRNFVAIGPSPSITEKVPKGLEDYVKAKQLSQSVVVNTFKPPAGGNGKEGMSYTILNPGAIGSSKNYGRDPTVPLDTIADAVVVGALGFYLNENESKILQSIDEISAKASGIGKVKRTIDRLSH